MKTRPIPFLLAAMLALTSVTFPTLGQEQRNPAPPATPPEGARRSPEADRPPGPPPGRGNPREGHPDMRRDGQRGPDDDRRPDEGSRREGERSGPGMGPGRERTWNIPLPPPAPPVPTPYIGVMTQPPPPVLGAQLKLKEGFGLVVEEVLPDSPGAKAGLKKYDVLTKFNDQQLVDSSQFATLVRSAGKDSDATLTVIREAKEQTVPVKIGERMAPRRMQLPGGMELRGQMDKWRGPAQEGMKHMQERVEQRMKDYGEKMRDYQERLRGWQKNPTGDAPQPPPAPTFEAERGEGPGGAVNILVEAQPGGPRQLGFFQPNGGVSFYTADAKMVMKDDTGEIVISTKDGKRTLVAKDPAGATIFDGPVDSEEQRKRLPEDLRKKLDSVQVSAAGIASPDDAPLPPPGFPGLRGGGDNVQ